MYEEYYVFITLYKYIKVGVYKEGKLKTHISKQDPEEGKYQNCHHVVMSFGACEII